MENINEPSPNVSISTGKSDEVNNDSMVYPSTLKIFQEIKKKTFGHLSWLNISHLEIISFANVLSFSKVNYFDKISSN